MAFVYTTTLVERLRTRLESLKLEPTAQNNQEKLIQRVGAFGANRMAAAMKATFASEQRVVFIVPGGDNHANTRERLMLRSVRTTSFALLIADQAHDAKHEAALLGGANALGILTMKDRIIDNLFDEPFTEADLVFAPGDGEPLIIQDSDRPANNLGRECYLLWLHAYAGERRAAVP